MIQNPGENHDEIAPIASDPGVQFSSVDKPEAAHISRRVRPFVRMAAKVDDAANADAPIDTLVDAEQPDPTIA